MVEPHDVPQLAPPDPERSAALASADELARNLMAAAAPVRFDVARSDEDRRAVYRLRYQVVIDRGWARPDDLPEHLERDDYDESAIHIVGWNAAALVATARVVFPAPGLQLPTERAFDLEIEPRGQVADMSRQIAAPGSSGQPHRLFAALLAKTWLEIRQGGYSLICGDFSAGALRLYRMLGFNVVELGPARDFWGEARHPILVDVASAASQLRQRWG